MLLAKPHLLHTADASSLWGGAPSWWICSSAFASEGHRNDGFVVTDAGAGLVAAGAVAFWECAHFEVIICPQFWCC